MSLAALGRVTINKEITWTNPRLCWEVVPVNPPTFTTTFENILDQGLRGEGFKDFDAHQGPETAEASLEGLAYPEHLGYFLEAILGTARSQVDPGIATRYLHIFNPNINCIVPSLSFEDYVPIGSANAVPIAGSVFRYSGMLCSNLTLKFNAGEGAVGWSASFMGKGGTPAIKQTTPSETAGGGTVNPPFLGWEGSAHIGPIPGVASADQTRPRAYNKLIDCEITFAREVILEHVGQSDLQPGLGYAGPLEATMKATIDLSHEEDFAIYRKNYKQEFGVTISKGDKYMSIVYPYASWLEAPIEIDRSGGHLKASWSMRGLRYAGTANSPVQVILRNGTPSFWQADKKWGGTDSGY